MKFLLNRTYVPKKPDKNVKAAEDFLELVLQGLVIIAADNILKNDHIPHVQDMAAKNVKVFCEAEI